MKIAGGLKEMEDIGSWSLWGAGGSLGQRPNVSETGKKIDSNK